MKRILSTALLVLASSVSPTLAASEWLPEDGQESLALQIAAKLGDTHLKGENNDPALLATAREAVAGIMEKIDSWGSTELANRAPILDELGLPSSGNPQLDAIARYGACTFHLDALFGNRALNETAPGLRVTAAIASAAIPLATANLRHHYLSEGGTDETLRAFLTGAEMDAAALRIKGNREMISYSWKECAPTLAALTGTAETNGEAPEESS